MHVKIIGKNENDVHRKGEEIVLEKNLCQKKYILFDLDGTLTDPKEGITKCVQYALKSFGIIEPDLDALTCFIGPPLLQSFVKYYGLSEEESKQAVAKFRERFGTVGIYENRLLDGIHEMLVKLREQGKVICLATSKPHVYANPILEKYGVHTYFDIVVGSERDGRRTNKDEVIAEVVRQVVGKEGQTHEISTGDVIKRAIMVGDRHHDMDGANACGMESIGVRFGYAEPNELEDAGATYIVETVEELTQLLLEL